MKRDLSICCVRSGKTELLLELVAGRLDAQTSAVIQQHAAACGACQDFIAAQAAVWAALEADAAPSVSPSFDARLYRRIGELRAESWWRRAWRWITEPVMPSFGRPAAAVSVALTAIVAIVLTQAPPPVEAPPATVSMSADLETIEETLNDFEMLQVLGDLPRSL